MHIEEAQQSVDQWIHLHGVRYFHQLTNMTLLMEEVGELSRWMAREYGEQSYKQSEDALNAKEAIQEEMADVLWVLLCLANQCEVNLDEALQKSFAKKTIRDSNRHHQNPKLQPE